MVGWSGVGVLRRCLAGWGGWSGGVVWGWGGLMGCSGVGVVWGWGGLGLWWDGLIGRGWGVSL